MTPYILPHWDVNLPQTVWILSFLSQIFQRKIILKKHSLFFFFMRRVFFLGQKIQLYKNAKTYIPFFFFYFPQKLSFLSQIFQGKIIFKKHSLFFFFMRRVFFLGQKIQFDKLGQTPLRGNYTSIIFIK